MGGEAAPEEEADSPREAAPSVPQRRLRQTPAAPGETAASPRASREAPASTAASSVSQRRLVAAARTLPSFAGAASRSQSPAAKDRRAQHVRMQLVMEGGGGHDSCGAPQQQRDRFAYSRPTLPALERTLSPGLRAPPSPDSKTRCSTTSVGGAGGAGGAEREVAREALEAKQARHEELHRIRKEQVWCGS